MRREGDPPVLVASSERAREELGWRPVFRSLEKIVDTARRFHVNCGFGDEKEKSAEKSAKGSAEK